MSLLKWLISKKEGKQNDQEIIDSGFCPNCWGSQSYDGKFIAAVEDQQIDINNHDSSHQRAFIQNFVATHLEPIKLKNHDIYDQCPACSAKYSKP